MLIVPISLGKHFQPSNTAALQMMATAADLPQGPRSDMVTHGIEVQLGGMGQHYREQAGRRYLANGDPRVDSLWKMFNNTY